MSVTNGERLVTKQDLADFYNDIRPYMGGIVTSKAGFTPIGTIISVMGTTAPTNYLACDGTVYNIADYTELANYFNEQFGSKNFFGGDGTTTFAVPDLRGEFLRGTGTNSHENQGNGASVGVHQNATEIPYYSLTKTGQIYTYNYDTNADTNIRNADKAVLKGTGSGNYINASMTSPSGGASKTANMNSVRPTNTSVLYCIATKNFYIDPTLDYSTEEKIVGTWIDGKPLYQKTVVAQFGTITDGTVSDVVVSNAIPSNSESMFIVNATSLNTSNKNATPLPYMKNDLTRFVKAYINNGELRIASNWNSYSNTNIYITIQYTKTTD